MPRSLDGNLMSISQPPVRHTYKRRKHLRGLRSEMHTRDSFIEPERPQDDAAGSYDRALASLIIAIANITSGPASTPPPGRRGGNEPAERQREARRRERFMLATLRSRRPAGRRGAARPISVLTGATAGARR
jgi:hypothetical protein